MVEGYDPRIGTNLRGWLARESGRPGVKPPYVVDPFEQHQNQSSSDSFEEALKKENKAFRKEHAEQIKSMRKALEDEGGSFDIWISW